MANLHKIRKLLEEKRITIVELCTKINMTPNGVTNAIKNNKITSDNLEDIAKVLNVPVGYFFDEKEATGIFSNESIVQYGNGANCKIHVSRGEEKCLIELEGAKKEIEALKEVIKRKMK